MKSLKLLFIISALIFSFWLSVSPTFASDFFPDYKEPVIDNISPKQGEVKIPVTLTGRNFIGRAFADGRSQMEYGFDYIRFGKFIDTEITSWSDSMIQIKVPAFEDASTDMNRLNAFSLFFTSGQTAVMDLLNAKDGSAKAKINKERVVEVVVVTTPIVFYAKESNKKLFTYTDKNQPRSDVSVLYKVYDDVVQEPLTDLGIIVSGAWTGDGKKIVDGTLRLIRPYIRGTSELPLFVRDFIKSSSEDQRQSPVTSKPIAVDDNNKAARNNAIATKISTQPPVAAQQPQKQPPVTKQQTSPARVLKNWELISGDPTDACTAPTYQGEVQIHGWYAEEIGYGGDKQWALHIADEDIKYLPLYEETTEGKNGFKNGFNSLVGLGETLGRKAPPALENKLKKATQQNPALITLRGYEIYCEGWPIVSIQSPVVAQQPQKQTPVTKQPTEKVVRIVANRADVWASNNRGEPPLGVIFGAPEGHSMDRMWHNIGGDSNPRPLKRGDIVKYISEQSAHAQPSASAPQSTQAVEVELNSGERGWIKSEWSYGSQSVTLAEVVSSNDQSKPLPPPVGFVNMNGKWQGVWKFQGDSGSFNLQIHQDADEMFVGKGSETFQGKTESFTIGGSVFGDKIFFNKYYPDREIFYTGTVTGKSASGVWQYSSGWWGGDEWSMDKAD